ncbi:aldose epimerase family protein [Piscibacillus halophilus]|uniref:Aldose 1-epimerase n=1 Tax=Piscibacillus halophilus TaxID=571933 RepID=A0A1H9HU17_9BACI|nr:aldose epimerase family protein [Piscibacillus halophilus]SEQ65843.1 aldose 1-epimerase [Piscibacillus halophilus]
MNIKQKTILNKWTEYTLTNDHHVSISLLDYGATITKWLAPDQDGQIENIVLSYDDYDMYEENPLFLGSVIGRVAGRIKNASFTVNQTTYHLEQNDGEHHLHGGSKGLHHHLWSSTPFKTRDAIGVQMTTTAKELEDGYPGDVDISVTYTLTNDNQLSIDYEAQPNLPTPIALTNHTYFNLSGDAKQTIHQHHVKFPASKILELDQNLIPTGCPLNNEGTTFDFRHGRDLKEGLESSHEQHYIANRGYDHYFLFDNEQPKVQVSESKSGRKLLIETNQPGMIMYSGNNIDSQFNINQRTGQKHLGVCFETQAHPASLLDMPLPSIIISGTYHQRTTFKILT